MDWKHILFFRWYVFVWLWHHPFWLVVNLLLVVGAVALIWRKQK